MALLRQRRLMALLRLRHQLLRKRPPMRAPPPRQSPPRRPMRTRWVAAAHRWDPHQRPPLRRRHHRHRRHLGVGCSARHQCAQSCSHQIAPASCKLPALLAGEAAPRHCTPQQAPARRACRMETVHRS
eukprot:140233-Chlamydomonas_euryale.AAC.3